MTVEIPLWVILVLPIPWAALGFLTGKYHERTKWNELIREGKLPKPK